MYKPPYLVVRPDSPLSLLLRPLNLYLLLSYLVLTGMTFLPLALDLPLAEPGQVGAMAVLAWTAVWAVFKRPAWFHPLLLPAFLALPLELYLYLYYDQGITPHHLGLLVETSPLETTEFLGSKVWLLLAVFVGVLVWWGSSWRAALSTRDLDWNHRSRRLVLGLLAVMSGLYVHGQWFADVPIAPAEQYARPMATVHLVAAGARQPAPPAGPILPYQPSELSPHWTEVLFPVDAFTQSWPFGLAARGHAFYEERLHLAELGQGSAAFRFGAYQTDPAKAPDVVVLVIGETGRFDRWSLNGYARETTPLLAQEANLVSLQDMITPVSATRLSVPVIISRKPATESLNDGFKEKSFLSAFKEAGYKTWWLSNQQTFGKFDTPVSVFAQEADSTEFLNLGGVRNRSNYDEVLLTPFERALHDPAPKKLIVLHALGSHWNYANRYPPQFDRWRPSLLDLDKPALTDQAIKPQLNNSYDNAILYTDWFLAELLTRLKERNAAATLMYVADHGETLYDGNCSKAFHGNNHQYEFHVPAFVWYSDAYGARFPDKVTQLRAHRTAPLSTENVFHTLLDLGDIRHPGEDLGRSIASGALVPHTRYVHSYGWMDYDTARIEGDCREVIGKDKKLPRN